jgi:hypothetical protein
MLQREQDLLKENERSLLKSFSGSKYWDMGLTCRGRLQVLRECMKKQEKKPCQTPVDITDLRQNWSRSSMNA